MLLPLVGRASQIIDWKTFLFKSSYTCNLTSCTAVLMSSTPFPHFHGIFSVAVFLALAQKDDVPVLNPGYKALTGSVVFPTWETAASEHKTGSELPRKSEVWTVIQR